MGSDYVINVLLVPSPSLFCTAVYEFLQIAKFRLPLVPATLVEVAILVLAAVLAPILAPVPFKPRALPTFRSKWLKF